MKEHKIVFGGPARMCVGQNSARLALLHATSKLCCEGADVRLAVGTMGESMEMVNYFAVKPKRGECVVVRG